MGGICGKAAINKIPPQLHQKSERDILLIITHKNDYNDNNE
jgi:hypothetical protein